MRRSGPISTLRSSAFGLFRPRSAIRQQVGAALLSAMLTVTLVATFASAALWQQFRSIEVETAERGRLQSALILTGALDWARLILREDGRTVGADHLAEPWAVPLEEARMSSFLAVDGVVPDSDREAFLSGTITDMQGRLNVANLLDGAGKSEVGMASFERLFELLDLPSQALATLVENYLAAAKRAGQTANAASAASAAAPGANSADSTDFLSPQRPDQLAWLGLDAQTLAALEPHISLLPARTPVNLNTASALVITASTPGLDLADAEKLVAARGRKHFTSLAEAKQSLGNSAVSFTDGQHSVATRFFEVRGRVRLDELSVFERSLVQRDGQTVRTLWRARGALSEARPASASLPNSRSKP
jgi:general secretion pathway protein K